ncbi:exosome non-catalytic core subunit rrp4 [Puccinia graminis f. sp. tritici]|uniref:Exosome non-catalytic core subunit rrp4 n=1 Tax=Puccinia graminis f. sp. tritici TaxID=56615 RepID=A0A5B0N1B4_PUCGR|nr:exosome non-catalytic core subunit rrp4 [Puccinia graminis f. sp. tritici]KAA1124047.1 exosome non-catalytic core subunit rrp4 [Puccinia graminis f. sp. tritici]
MIITGQSIFTITHERAPTKEIPLDCSGSGFDQPALVVPGEMIASSKYWMRGHGTFIEEQSEEQEVAELDGETQTSEGLIRSSLAGTVERINKLITVIPLSGRYRPEVGDLVIGRITEVQSKRWKVEAGGRQHAVLMLGSVNLPGGVQRRKLESDELQMRFFFQEGDLLVAEVQGFFGDGSMSLHTRSRKYGKLRNGMLLKVPSQLILRLKSHFHILPIGIDLIIGVNGWIWIAQQRAHTELDESLKEAFEAEADNMYSDVNEPISTKTRANIARLAGAINLLSTHSIPISDSSILRTYQASLEISRLSRLDDDQPMDVDGSEDPSLAPKQELDGFLKPEFREKVLALLVASS